MDNSYIDFPDVRTMPDNLDLVAFSAADLNGNIITSTDPNSKVRMTIWGSTYDPEVLLSAYERGLFPMPLEVDGNPTAIGWWSPARRAIFYPDQIRITRSLKQSLKKYRVTFDTAFEQVMRSCGDPSRPQGWITEDVIEAYVHMHQLGHAHSVEVWDRKDKLVGGLYGVESGGVFAGESMFHTSRDASKVALVHLANRLNDGRGRIIDTQWMTDHLKSLGAQEMSRSDYVDLIATKQDVPSAFR